MNNKKFILCVLNSICVILLIIAIVVVAVTKK